MRTALLWLPVALLALLLGEARASSSLPQNGLITFESVRDGRPAVWTMAPDGSDQEKLIDGASGYGMDWSPDGTLLALTRESSDGRDFEVMVLNVATGALVNLTNDRAFDADPAWSPDGSLIAFVSDRHGGGTSEIYVMDSHGGNIRRVTFSAAGALKPAWSPDGLQIAYQRGDQATNSAEIYVINLDGTGEHNLTRSPWLEKDPAWSPDGSLIVFHSVRPDNGSVPGLYVMRADGSGQRLLMDVAANRPEWSPDGRFLAYSREATETGSFDIFIANAGGSGEHNVTFHSAPDQIPAWQPVPSDMTPPRSGDGGLLASGAPSPRFFAAIVFVLAAACLRFMAGHRRPRGLR